MDKNKNNIEDLFKEKLDDFAVEPSKDYWPGLKKDLAWSSFWRFNARKINAWYVGALVILASSTSLFYFPEQPAEMADQSEKSVPIENTEISENSIQKAPKLPVSTEKTEQTHSQDVNQAPKNTQSETSSESFFLADFELSAEHICASETIELHNQSQNAESFYWDFGDGNMSTRANPSHTYNKPGTYEVTLTINGADATQSLTKKVEVIGLPEPSFKIDSSKSDFDKKIIAFSNTSNNASRYQWKFGDGETSLLKNPRHQYKKYGSYDVKLIANNKTGCPDSISKITGFLNIECFLNFPKSFAPQTFEPANPYYQAETNKASVFFPDYSGIQEYELRIYDQFGHELYTSKDINKGWNGYVKGQLVPEGKYQYKAMGTYKTGEKFSTSGIVNVLVSNRFDNFSY